MQPSLKPYLMGSAAAHAAAFAAFLFILPAMTPHIDKVYMIDFVGGSAATLTTSGPTAAPAPAAPAAASAPSRVPRESDPDAFRTRGHKAPIALPRPSLLSGAHDADEPAPSPSSIAGNGPRAPAAPSSKSISGSAGASSAPSSAAGVATDMPDFPYPEYISQVRLMLWESWRRRLPIVDAEAVVGFSILRDGGATDLQIESSSGDPDVDQRALDAVKTAAPFPPLPTAFKDQFLKIHLTLKSEASWR